LVNANIEELNKYIELDENIDNKELANEIKIKKIDNQIDYNNRMKYFIIDFIENIRKNRTKQCFYFYDDLNIILRFLEEKKLVLKKFSDIDYLNSLSKKLNLKQTYSETEFLKSITNLLKLIDFYKNNELSNLEKFEELNDLNLFEEDEN
jgi:uncharacterized protein YjcR